MLKKRMAKRMVFLTLLGTVLMVTTQVKNSNSYWSRSRGIAKVSLSDAGVGGSIVQPKLIASNAYHEV